MDEKMESENSYTDESSGSSETSSESSEADEELMETVRLLGHTMELPQELCEDYSVFKEFFSMKTWDALEDNHKEQLMEYLPKFSENDKEEKDKTVKMLFNYEPFHFTSPLGDFYNNLRQGNYRPDIAKMRKFLKKARAKQQKHKIKSYYAKLLPEVLITRERLLAIAKAAPPGPTPYLPLLPAKPKNNYKPIYLRARHRYFEELAAIRSEVGGDESEDDNYPEGPPELASKKHKNSNTGHNTDNSVAGTLGGTDSSQPTSLECLKNFLSSHRLRRQYRENHPELNTSGITLDDIKQRVALVNGAKKLMFGGQKTETPIQKLRKSSKKEISQKPIKDTKSGMHKKLIDEDQRDIVENKPLLPNIKIKCEREESDSESSSFIDPISSPKQSKMYNMDVDVKQEVDKYPESNNLNEKLECEIKQEPLDPVMLMQNSTKITQPVPIKLEDLDGIDMMALPVELADESGEMLSVEADGGAALGADEPLAETTHASFLSLVRALFPARAAHRASRRQLRARCAAVIRSPIAPLNTWYHLSDDWCAELDSALEFLAGERGPHPDDFVPYLQYIPETQMYQWIGAGRDCDALLGRLCERWLRAAGTSSRARARARPRAAPPAPPPAPAPAPPSTAAPASLVPPPRYPTSWIVRPPTASELAEFRAQERRRFSSAAKPFTYIQHGYRSVVGPCARGGGGAAGGVGAAGAAGGAGAGAGGALLCPSRPRHASFTALVRDAAARLPNGEGTRAHILVLLKMSQYIAACSEQALLGALSAALERLLAAKRDPVLKCDHRTGVWTYLHRHRSEEDWSKTAGGRARGGKAVAAAASASSPAPATPASRPSKTQSLPHQEVEVDRVEEVGDNASDSDVDVDDSGESASPPRLSSAQLLMRAQAQAQAPAPTAPAPAPAPAAGPAPAHRPKPNQTKPHTLPTKTTPLTKPVTSKPNLMAQSAKLANFISQSTKTNAPQTAQTAKQTSAVQSPKPTVTQQTKQMNPVPQVKPTVVQTVSKEIVSQAVAKSDSLTHPTKTNMGKSAVLVAKQISVSKQVIKPSDIAASKVVTSVPAKHLVTLKQTSAAVKASAPSVAAAASPRLSPLLKQRPLLKIDNPQTTVPPSSIVSSHQNATTAIVVQPTATVAVAAHQNQSKQVVQGARSLLIRPTAAQTAAAAPAATTTTLAPTNPRRGVVRVVSPAAPAAGKSLISPRALQQNAATTKKRTSLSTATLVTTMAQTSPAVSSAAGGVSAAGARTVQLGGRTVQLAGAHPVQLAAGHALLSSLQLPAAAGHASASVRLPSGQTVQLAAHAVRALTAARPGPMTSVQLTGQTVQLAGQTVQLAGPGPSVQLAGHTVKLPSGQSVRVAGQSVQLPGGQTVQLAGSNLQTVQLPGGQTLQLATGQTVQLASGQTLQLAGGQTVQLANQQAPKSLTQVVRAQTAGDKAGQPLVAKLLTNAQPQMLSVQGVGVGVGAGRGRAPVRVPLLLAAAKQPGQAHIILQQSDGGGIRVTSTGGTPHTQTLVLSNIGAQATTTASPPILKLQQVTPLQQVKLAQGIKIQQAVSGASVVTSIAGAAAAAGAGAGAGTGAGAVRGVVMDGQQLKLVGGRHVLARLLRPAHPPH